MIDFECPECEESLSVADELAGKKIKCRNCEESIRVPGVDPAARSSRRGSGDRDPLLFGFVAGYARVLIALNVLALIGGLFFVLHLSAQGDNLALGLAYLGAILHGIFLLSLTLLLVDMARTLRRIARNTER